MPPVDLGKPAPPPGEGYIVEVHWPGGKEPWRSAPPISKADADLKARFLADEYSHMTVGRPTIQVIPVSPETTPTPTR